MFEQEGYAHFPKDFLPKKKKIIKLERICLPHNLVNTHADYPYESKHDFAQLFCRGREGIFCKLLGYPHCME